MNPHYTNTDNPIDFPKMTKYVHIVQIHPVELGKPNLHKVIMEKEFNNAAEAHRTVVLYNKYATDGTQAVYHGRVNGETGELE